MGKTYTAAKAAGLSPSHLFSKKAKLAPTATVRGESWWVGLEHAALNAEAARRFTPTAPLGVIVNTKGVLDLE